MSDSQEADKKMKLNSLTSRIRIKLKKITAMKTRYKIAVLALVAVAGSALLGGSFWWWLVGIAAGKFIIRLLFTIALAIVGKSSVSCPLKPSDSAPLKHSTMPP